MKGIKTVVLLAVFLTFILAVHGSVQSSEIPELGEGYDFVFVNPGDPADPFHAKIVVGWKEAAKALRVETSEFFAYGDLARVLDYVDSAIGMGVDGIYVFNVDPEGLHPYVERALENNISVVLMSSPDPVFGKDEVPYVGYSLEDQGYVVGEYLADKVEPDSHIALFAEFIAPYSAQRRSGILGALDDAGITYTASDTFETGEELARTVDTIKTYLLAHPETDVVVGLGSITTPSGFIALHDLGYEPGEVLWVGFDLLPETVEGIKAGYGAANLDEVFNFGFYGLTALYLRTKYDFAVEYMHLATVMVDETNIDDYVYWVEKGIK